VDARPLRAARGAWSRCSAKTGRAGTVASPPRTSNECSSQTRSVSRRRAAVRPSPTPTA